MRRPFGINPFGRYKVLSVILYIIIALILIKYIFKIQIP